MLKLALTPRWLAGLLLALLMVTGFMMLSKWQFDASSRSITVADPAKDTLRPYSDVLKAGEPITSYTVDTVVEAEGKYVAGSSYLVANRLDDGAKGYWVISEFIPEGTDTVTTSTTDHKPRTIAVARAWTKDATIPAEPTGEVKIAGRVISNDSPVTSNQLDAADQGNEKILGSAATAQLTNLWDSPLYSGVLAARTEVPASQKIPSTSENTISDSATILGETDTVRPIKAEQVVNSEHNWLNIFYSLEWIVFAVFAIYLWLHMLKDAADKEKNPTHYYEYSGEYFLDEETGRYYYWDEEDQQYYFFDETPEPQTHNS